MAQSSRTPANRLGLLAAGLLLGLILALVAVRLYVREAERERVEAAIRERIQLPREAFRVERINPDRSIRASLRRVAVLDRAGDTIVSAPRVRVVFDPASLAGEGPLVFRDVDVERPTLRLVQGRNQEWNVAQAFALEADGTPVRGRGAEEAGRGVVLRGMRITGGRLLLAMPWTPEDSLLAGADPRIVRMAGTRMLVRTARELEARVALTRFGGTRGWRVEVSDATALLAEPRVGRLALRGWAEEEGDGFRFGLDRLRTGQSFVTGEGRIGLGGETLAYDDITLRAAPLSFRDLQWIRPTLPGEGTARFLVDVDTRAGGRTAYGFRELDVRLRGSRAFGRMGVVTREDGPPTFYDTRLTLDPLLLSDLEALGAAENIPYDGRITGTLASVEAIRGTEGTLRIDLAASVTPEGVPGAPRAALAAHGLVAFGDQGVRMRDLRVEADPLPLMALAPFVENREILRGVIRGSALLSGTTRDLRIDSGLLAYEVGAAPPSRIRIADGRITMDPGLRYRLDLRAEPLALATLTELYPSLPFRAATLSGPVTLTGTPESLRFDADLYGPAGGIAAAGTVGFGEVPRFDVSGRVEAFRTGAVLARGAPLEGPLTGTFSVRGTTADLRFATDMRQGTGTFALQGRMRGAAGARQFDVSGTVNNFRVGTLLGRPGLLPSPVTGTLAFAGGGRQPYRFDVDLRGQVGAVDLEGWYAPGPVPAYSVSGAVAGLNLEGLPRAGVLPATSLTGTVALRGQGTTLDTFSGDLSFRATGPSSVGGVALQTAVVDLTARGDLLTVRDVRLAMGTAQLTATGSIGLTRPAGEGLRFSFSAQDLRTLAGVIPPEGPLEPDMAGSIQMTGTVTGAFRSPEVAAGLRADGLRFNEWRAGVLAGSFRASRRGEQWLGEGSLQGERLVFAGGESLQSLRLEANVTPVAASFGVFARRNPESE
ncbi:MAG: hypothetical protein M3P24_07070, partial [Gemmatimonadota bacterium]|nr:hypothetical protein [Gemmatimonadota bacterium]